MAKRTWLGGLGGALLLTLVTGRVVHGRASLAVVLSSQEPTEPADAEPGFANPQLIVSTDWLVEHLDDDAGCLSEIARVCEPGGHVLIHVPAFPVLWSKKDELNHHRRRYRNLHLGQSSDESCRQKKLLGVARKLTARHKTEAIGNGLSHRFQ